MKHNRVAVGFYKDSNGKTRPITKSTNALSRRKVVHNAKRFKEVTPKKKKVTAKVMVNKFWKPITRPAENASLWYVYYYLSEFAPLHPVYKRLIKREFDRLSEKLDQAFLHYGTYAILRELRHMKDHTKDFGDYYERYGEGSEEFEDEVKKLHLTPKERNFAVFMMDLTARRDIEYPDKARMNIISWLSYLNKNGLDLTPRKELFKTAEGLFEKLDWVSTFGGRTWAKIARTMAHRYNVSRTMWIDMMWSLQHNTGTWLNKVAIPSSRKALIEKRFNVWPRTLLNFILDDKREARLKNVGKAAAYFNPKLKDYLKFLPRGKRSI